MEHRRIETNGTELHVTSGGAGPPVLLMHGWPHTWQVWRPVLPLLAGARRVIAPDLRGLGDSARAADGFDAATGAEDMLGLLDALAVDRADVVAIDAGVPAAFLLGALHPDRVGTSAEIVERLRADAAVQEVDELRLELP
ncbi:alpha/beta fold hydrolase [Dactylosporangium sp. NPDC005555]|uniref:alpha/beta fold hydrolase n=1 Tax=Dactylosporangium sp. NPDC005555 TaxID=3154889 RepID=UPI0033BF5E6D